MPVILEPLLITPSPSPMDLRLWAHPVLRGWQTVAVTQAEIDAWPLPRKEA
jgi:hypothetical protein